ncbi:hypothetical protein TNCT_566791 [Trichonephila clavata]|uniref:Uncharacterized protein n=1 Tax=Trichonephila clavata TaxID=2740835 RepID=A0A8X6J316_TRICU|nr:hypothetical protein TNCT_566791 [Trichonephila clavata]
MIVVLKYLLVKIIVLIRETTINKYPPELFKSGNLGSIQIFLAVNDILYVTQEKGGLPLMRSRLGNKLLIRLGSTKLSDRESANEMKVIKTFRRKPREEQNLQAIDSIIIVRLIDR